MVGVTNTMHNFTHLVHEDHHLLLQDFGGVSKVADAAEPEDRFDFLAWNHGVQLRGGAALHVVHNDLGARLAKAQGKEASELDQSPFQDGRLQGFQRTCLPLAATAPLSFVFFLFLFPVLNVTKLHGVQRVLSDGLQFHEDALQWAQQKPVGVFGEGECPHGQGRANEEGLQHAETGCCLNQRPGVEDKKHIDVACFHCGGQHRYLIVDLVAAQLVCDRTGHGQSVSIAVQGQRDPHKAHALLPPGFGQPPLHLCWDGLWTSVLTVPFPQLVLGQSGTKPPSLIELRQGTQELF
mmetsp:Transcript_69625/g.166127  ORF Transcript_69625/g.166127 Transcript_69625/m.166127 type:complete len:294 (+) Transcript_69625:959-1840(+)